MVSGNGGFVIHTDNLIVGVAFGGQQFATTVDYLGDATANTLTHR